MDWDIIRENKGILKLSTEMKKELRSYLTSRGFMPTKQYLDVAELLLLNRKHLTVDNIYNELHPLDTALSRSRLYTMLDILVRLEVVHKISTDATQEYYNWGEGHHVHFICKHCGNITDLDIKLPERIEGVVDRVERFSATLSGECISCAKRRVN